MNLAQAKASADTACTVAERAYRHAFDENRAAHRRAIKELADLDMDQFADGKAFTAWWTARKGGSRDRLETAMADLQAARIDQLAAEHAVHLDRQAAEAKAGAVRYADRLTAAEDTADEAMALAATALMKASGTTKVDLR